jgi:hypothetical protein
MLIVVRLTLTPSLSLSLAPSLCSPSPLSSRSQLAGGDGLKRIRLETGPGGHVGSTSARQASPASRTEWLAFSERYSPGT